MYIGTEFSTWHQAPGALVVMVLVGAEWMAMTGTRRFDHWPALKCFSVFHDNATWWLQICSLSFIVVHYNVQWPRYFSKRLQLSTMPTLTFQLHPHIEAFLESEITRLVVGGGNFEHSGQHPHDDYNNLLNIIKKPGMMMMTLMKTL